MCVDYITGSCSPSAATSGKWFYHTTIKKIMLCITEEGSTCNKFVSSDGVVYILKNTSDNILVFLGIGQYNYISSKNYDKNIYSIESFSLDNETGNTFKYWPTIESNMINNVYIKTNEKNKFVHLKTGLEVELTTGYLQRYNCKVSF